MDLSDILASGKSSQEKKEAVMNELRNQANIQNARILVEAINDNCFDRCVASPGNSLSYNEESCLTRCMDKYMSAWNTVSKQYLSRIQKESTNRL